MTREYGDMLVTVVAALSPVKAAKLLKFQLRPLSLHHKGMCLSSVSFCSLVCLFMYLTVSLFLTISVHVLTDVELARPRNRIQFTGNVAMPALHEWVGGSALLAFIYLNLLNSYPNVAMHGMT